MEQTEKNLLLARDNYDNICVSLFNFRHSIFMKSNNSEFNKKYKYDYHYNITDLLQIKLTEQCHNLNKNYFFQVSDNTMWGCGGISLYGYWRSPKKLNRTNVFVDSNLIVNEIKVLNGQINYNNLKETDWSSIIKLKYFDKMHNLKAFW